MKELLKEINELFNNYERHYKQYSKETMFKALHIDIVNISNKHLKQKRMSKLENCRECKERHEIENLFLYNDELYCSWCLLYKLCDDGIINLSHDDFEEKGVEVII